MTNSKDQAGKREEWERAEAIARTLAFSQQAIVAIADAILEARAEEVEHCRQRFADARWSQAAISGTLTRRAAELRSQKSHSGPEER